MLVALLYTSLFSIVFGQGAAVSLNLIAAPSSNLSGSVLLGRSTPVILPPEFWQQPVVCPQKWDTIYQEKRNSSNSRPTYEKGCLKKISTPMTYDRARMYCHSQNASVAAVDKTFKIRNNVESPNYRFQQGEYWTGFVKDKNALFYDGSPPTDVKSSVFSISSVKTLSWTQLYLEGEICFSVDINIQTTDFKMIDCSKKQVFHCQSRGIDYTMKTGMSFCENPKLVGNKYLEFCYAYLVINQNNSDGQLRIPHQQAKRQCQEYGADLVSFNLTDSEDYRTARVLLEPYVRKQAEVWFTDKNQPDSCTVVGMDIDYIISSKDVRCTYTALNICQKRRILKSVSSDDVSISFVPPTIIPGQFSGGNVTCIFPKSRQETDTYIAYRGNKIAYKLPKSEWQHTFTVMSWNREVETLTDFLVSGRVTEDIQMYRCEVYREYVGLIASKKIYAHPTDKHMLIFYGSIKFQPGFSITEALDYNLFNKRSTKYYRTSSSLYNFYNYIRSNLQLSLNQWQTSQKITKIGSVGDSLEFTMFFSAEAASLTSEIASTLIADISQIASSYSQKPQGTGDEGATVVLDVKSFQLKSEVLCTSEFISKFSKRFDFFPTKIGEKALSRDLCITDLRPLLSGTCIREDAAPARVVNVNVNPKCLFIFNLANTTRSPLANLSSEDVTDSNAAKVASETANLTSSSDKLEVSDVISTSIIVDKIAKLVTVEEEALEGVVQTISNILSVPDPVLQRAQSISSSSNRLLESIETIASRVNLTGKVFKRNEKNLSLVISESKPGQEPFIGIQSEYRFNNTNANETIDLLTPRGNINTTTAEIGILLPKTLITGKSSRVVLQIYRNTNFFKTRSARKDFILNSKVAAATLVSDGEVITTLNGRFVTAVFKPLEERTTVCGYWDYSLYENSGGWSTKGCVQRGVEEGRVICECDHLTNFAILIDIRGQDDLYGSRDRLIMSIITIVGLSLSIAGLGLTVLSFILFKHMRKGRGQQTLFNLALSMLCTMIVFLAGIEQTENYVGCIVVAAMIHYFLLVSFMWMLVEGFLQYLRFVRVLGTYIPKFMMKVSLFAWGVPLIPLIVVLAVDHNLYKGGNFYCWMSRTPFYYGFLVPIGVVVLTNCIIFAVVLKNLLNRPEGLQSTQSDGDRAIMNLRAAISIFVLLGLTWIFGILAIEEARVAFSYIFTILTTLQGFFIFILFVAREKQFRNHWKTLCCKKTPKSKYTAESSADSSAVPFRVENPAYSLSSSVSSNGNSNKY